MKKSRPILWILIIAAVALAGYWGWQRFYGAEAAKTQTAQKGAPRGPAVPVSIAPVQKADFPVYLTGLGTVQGFNTVQVRTRVDGQIDKIAFTEGQIVNQGDLLVEIDPRPYQAAFDQAKAKKAQDEANLANANLDLQRYTKLGEFATRQQTDTQRSTVAQLTAQIEPITVIFTAPEDQLPYITEGQAAGALKVIALTTDGKKTLAEGKLAVVNNQVDTTSGTIRLKAVFDNKDHALWPGQSVSTRLLVRTIVGATLVPDDAVQHSTNGLYAYTVNQDNKAELRKIKVGYSIDGRSVVDEGLSPGQQVITGGQFRVQPGSLVTTAVASSNPGQNKVRHE